MEIQPLDILFRYPSLTRFNAMYQKVVTSLPPLGIHAFSQLGVPGAERLQYYPRKYAEAVAPAGNESPEYMQKWWYYIYVFFKWMAMLVTAASLGCCLTLLAKGLYETCETTQCNSKVFTVNTYLASYESDSNMGWPVATERIYNPDDLSKNVFTGSASNVKWNWMHYGECMHSAGFLEYKCNSSNVAEYKTCVETDTDSNALINSCQGTGTPANYQWPTPDRYTECLMADTNPLRINRARKNAFTYCLHNAFWPFYQVPQGIDSRYFLGSYNWVLFLFVALWIMTSFGVYTAYPIDYENIDDGGSNKVENGIPRQGYQRLGFWWAFVPVVWNTVLFAFTWAITFRDDLSYWKKDNVLFPTTVSTGIITIVASSFGLFYFLNVLSELYFPGYTFVTQAMRKLIYKEFQNDMETQGRKTKYAQIMQKNFRANRANRVPIGTPRSIPDPSGTYAVLPQSSQDPMANSRSSGPASTDRYWGRGEEDNTDYTKHKQDSMLGGSMLPAYPSSYNVGHNNIARTYIPPLTTVWADSYVVDPLFVLGMLGGIGQLTTDDAWNVFFLVLFYRICHMILARLIYEAFVADDTNINKVQTQKVAHTEGYTHPEKRNALFGIKVHALAVQVAAWYFLVSALVILWDKEKSFTRFSLLTGFSWLGFLVPEILRSILHLVLQAQEFMSSPNLTSGTRDPWGMTILTVSQFIWTWDMAVRLCYTMVIYFSDADYMGTKSWLQDNYQGLVVALPTISV
jgi:hypothetical protein